MRYAFVLAAFAGLSTCAADRPDPAKDWPLVSIRATGGFSVDPAGLETMAQLLERYPGACDDIWFASKGHVDIETLRKDLEKVGRAQTLFAKSGVKVSFQQGYTLGHSPWQNGVPPPDAAVFPDDAWMVDADGRRQKGIFCPRAESLLAYQKTYVKTVVESFRPFAYWLDDDLRLGVFKQNGCFCPRCLAAFNAKTGGAWTRETLTGKLFNAQSPRESVRRAWIDFNAESLALFGQVSRTAVDELGSDCRLAYQAVWSDTIYTGWDTRPLLAALSRDGAVPAGIRPGAGWYREFDGSPCGAVRKCFSVAREAERCKDFGPMVGTVCHEMESYPRHFLNKSPGMAVAECALAMASGCDAVSVYWYCPEPPQPVYEHERLVRRLFVARPYFERLRREVRRTRLGGVARYVGAAAAECPAFDLRDEDDVRLASIGVPVTCAEAKQGVWYVNAKSVGEMTAADWGKLAKTGAAVTPDAWPSVPKAASAKLRQVGVFDPCPDVAFRQTLLDSLDALQPGGLPVRIDASRPVCVLPRVDSDGRTSSVTLFNLSAYGTDGFSVRVRRPAGGRVEWVAADGARVVFRAEPCGDELVIRLDDLPGGTVGTFFIIAAP